MLSRQVSTWSTKFIPVFVKEAEKDDKILQTTKHSQAIFDNVSRARARLFVVR